MEPQALSNPPISTRLPLRDEPLLDSKATHQSAPMPTSLRRFRRGEGLPDASNYKLQTNPPQTFAHQANG